MSTRRTTPGASPWAILADGGRRGEVEILDRWLAPRRHTLERPDRLAAAEPRHGAGVRRLGRVSVEQQVCEWACHRLDHDHQLLAAEEAFRSSSIAGLAGPCPPPSRTPVDAAS